MTRAFVYLFVQIYSDLISYILKRDTLLRDTVGDTKRNNSVKGMSK